MAANLTAVAVAMIGAAAGLLGLYFSRKGQKRSEDSQQAAVVFKAQQDLFNNAIEERDRAEKARLEDRATFDLMAGELRDQLAQCRDASGRLTQDLISLRKIVSGEIARAAADTASEGEDWAEVEEIRRFIDTMREIGEP